jgi:hypothetical protein
MSKKPIGYSKKDRDEMKTLIERTEPKSGDYVGSGTVTQVPKKKKMKRMQMGGMAGGRLANPAITGRPISRPEVALNPADSRPFGRGLEGRPIPVRGGGGVPLQGPGGVMVKPPIPEMKPRPASPGPVRGMMRDRMAAMMERKRGMKGGGLARKGVGMALAKGGLVNANGCAQRGKTKGRMM